MGENKQLQKAVIKISEHYNTKHVIQRALINGIFSAAGLFLGAIIVFLLVSRLFAGFKEIPFVDDFLKQSKLDVVIESQLNEISGSNSTDETAELIIDENGQIKYLTYHNTSFGLEFSYPKIFTNLSEGVLSENQDSYLIYLSGGQIYLEEIQVYIDHALEYSGSSYKKSIESESHGKIDIEVYEEGATIGGIDFNKPTLIAEIKAENHEYLFIGFAKENNSALAREIMLTLLSSVKVI